MPLTGSLSAPSSCLRCQLREIILSTRLRTAPRCHFQPNLQLGRGFKTSIRRCHEREDEDDTVFLQSDGKEDERRTRYRREYPLGRIVGEPGRKQREHSQTLRIDSMKRPFDVVLMQDIQESKEQPPPVEIDASQARHKGPVVTAAEVASGLLNQDEVPSQDEVDASIDALRPDTSTLDEQEFKGLSQQLAEGYNIQQLSSYLIKHRQSPSKQASSEQSASLDAALGKLSLSNSSWRAGRTPIEKRHAASNALKKTKKGQGKKRITEQILRSAWNLSVRSEEDEIGELELSMESWQFQYLFNQDQDGKRNYEHLVHSPFLLQRSEVLLYTLSSTMRIVARQRDAEEIARLVQQDLQQIGSLELDLTAFKPILGKLGSQSSLVNVYQESTLRHIGQHTECVIERSNDNMLLIFSKSATARQHAQRQLISLLDLPSPTSVEVYFSKDERKTELFRLPEGNESGLHYRDRALSLSRLTRTACRLTNDTRSPVVQSTGAEVFGEDDRSAFTKKLVQKVEKLGMSTPSHILVASGSVASTDDAALNTISSANRSYWRDIQDPNARSMEVQVCRVMQPDDSPAQSTASKTSSAKRTISAQRSTHSVIHANIPAINTLLSYFQPFDENQYAFDSLPAAPSIVAHLFPSPFSAKGIDVVRKLPRLEIWHQVASRDSERSSDLDSLHLSDIRAILHQNELRVLLPEEVVDLRILHRSSLIADLKSAGQDDEIKRFSEALRESVDSESGALAGRPSLKVKLPTWVVDGRVSRTTMETSKNDAEVVYLFEGFEHVQTVTYSPIQPDDISARLDPRVEEVLHSMSDSMYLECKATEGGIIGGSRSELTLKYKDESLPSQSPPEYDKQREKNSQLVESALSLADVLTKINAGKIGSLQGLANTVDE